MRESSANALGPKPTKACGNLNITLLTVCEMKCVADGIPPCRRCRRTNTICIFRPRSNAAAAARDTVALPQASIDPSREMSSVLSRLDRIERKLNIYKSDGSGPTICRDLDHEEGFGYPRLWKAVKHLRSITRPSQEDAVWSRPVVKHLWTSFLDNLPLLHFLKDQSAFASPSPLLLASILYISALHGPSKDFGEFAQSYFIAQCCAIAELSQPDVFLLSVVHPDNTQTASDSAKEVTAFQDILGLIMASLSSEAYVSVTGQWIAVAYRLLLDHTLPTTDPGTSRDWSGLFSGLQVIDIEHASMHMCYPLLPEHSPAPALAFFQSSDNDEEEQALRGLTQMMHRGLSHFVGRGLPTIWSFVSAQEPDGSLSVRTPFTDEDARVIRSWARKLDDWLIRYNGASQPSPSDRQGILILLQYHLHKLYVLSIYHPARGFDLGSSPEIAPAERHELLVSARAVVRLRLDDSSIWSNWDMIMITFAAMLLLRGIEDGMSHPDDRHLIEKHITRLKPRHPSIPSIHHVLAERLESNLQAMHTPPEIGSSLNFPCPAEAAAAEQAVTAAADFSWAIFDQEILSLANPPWLLEDMPGGS
ncbi:fungal specific transcription factor domain-containing protein [Aspergillus saccharolyticus JOP 1030-1]|uniref:Zn(2)-C6 fungal-type domain-containing protein n=1 Tax=Aspergillus saccharolyticus JOP 1030-1 TaxID=1450539 RepID=A0A318ZIL4_9EURO|nr:hypothetical protein BP01DRAFT_291706 [Aspergillus saccharolyticus JOP 1030-1]PYH47406.1 hypothetical protein BP01DRAFT_291706 [Aspergillus saccharolyticus JOP 1030-1]